MRIPWLLLLLVGFVICLKSIREPDLWWMYRTGEWMLENGVTYKDPFSYTQEGVNWINVKWLFEILIVFFKALGGPEMIFVLQGIVSIGILLLIGRSTGLLAQKQQIEKDSIYWSAITLSGLFALIAIDFRLIGRPEMMSHLFTAAFLYLFILYNQQRDTKWIYALIPLQMLWANLHEGFGTGMVLIVAFLVMNWLEAYWRGNIARPLSLSWASLGALAAVVINPRGYELWLHPLNIFSQLKDNQYTTELHDYTNPAYWQKEAFINIGFLIVAVLAFFVSLSIAKKKEEKVAEAPKNPKKKESNAIVIPPSEPSAFWERYGFAYPVIVGLLFYLSLTAYRNIPFFIIAATPLVALGTARLLHKLSNRVKILVKALPIVSALLVLALYVSVVSNNYQKWSASRDEYGLQVLNGHNPVGAADFIVENKIKGRCMADYLTSSYLLWRLKPDFKTYIDLRDLDIFPKSFFSRYGELSQNPAVFEEEDKKYKFDYVVLLRRNIEGIPTLYSYLQESAAYDLVFADAVAVVYLKNTEANKALIEKYALDSTNTRDVFHYLPASKSSTLPGILNKVFNPLFKNKSYEGVNQDAIAAHLYYSIGASDLAMKYARKGIEKGIDAWRAYEIMGLVEARRFLDPKTAPEKKAEYGAEAIKAFDKALSIKADALDAIFGKAVILMENQKFAEALPYLQQASKIDPQNPQIQQHIAVCYDKLKK